MKQLKILTCLKQVPDPEGPAVAFKVDPDALQVTAVGLPPVISPFDENALEAALRIKDTHSVRITVLSIGEQLAQPVLKKALSVGADELMLLKDVRLRNLDSYSTANVLSHVIRKTGPYDIILTGRQAGDWDFGTVGLLLAEMLGIPCISFARKIEVQGTAVIAEKLTEVGYEVVTSNIPVLITVTSELGDLRYPSLKRLQAVRKESAVTLHLDEIGVDPRNLRERKIRGLCAPDHKRVCKFIEGKTAQEMGKNLAIQLREDSVI